MTLDPAWRLFMLEAQVALAEAPDLAQTLKRGAQLCVSRLADWCVIHEVTGPQHALQRAAVAHVDLRLEPALEEATRGAGTPSASRGVTEVARTGVPELQAKIPDLAWLAEGLGVPRSIDLDRLGGACAWTCLPMRLDGEVVGVASLVSTQSPGCQRDPEELERAQQLVDLVAKAAAKARRYEQALAASQAREEFLLVAAHELRTPLTALHLNIQSLARLVDRQGTSAANERVRNGLSKALRQCSSFEQLIEMLLDGAATRSGHLELQRQEVDLGELVEDVTTQLEVELEHAGCAVERCFEALVTGSWDRARLEQVVVNLLTNAIKYAPGRPIELRVEARGDRARLEVRDHGAGIPSEQRQRIFERFARGASAGGRHSGWGLGLYIVRQIVEAHGGTVEVQGAPSSGAVFVVELPREGRRS